MQETSIRQICTAGFYTVSDFQDAFIADKGFRTEIIPMSQDAGADRVRLCDTVGRNSWDHANFEIGLALDNKSLAEDVKKKIVLQHWKLANKI